MTDRENQGGMAAGRLAVWLGALALAAVAVLVLRGTSGQGEKERDLPSYVLRRGPLTISVTESGTIEAREQVIIKSEVEGKTTIIGLVPEGTRVRKGDLLIELDASKLQDQRSEQDIKVLNAEAAFVRARENLEVVRNKARSDIDKAELDLRFAEEDLKKFREGEFPKKVMEAEAKVALAEEELQRAAERLKWSEVLFGEKYISQTERQADELAANKARLDLELARADLELLNEFTYQRELAQLESDVRQNGMALERTRREASADIVQAEAELRAKKSEYEQQQDKLLKLEQQLARTRITAPAAGMVVYATSAQATWRGNAEPLAEGQEVHERQELIHLPTADSFAAEIKVHESSLKKITVGMPARLTVDALPERSFAGRVSKIAPLPDAQSVFLNPDLKVFRTRIDIEGESTDLRTGMSCRAEIVIARHDGALFVPVQAVLRVKGTPTVYVRAGGEWQPREVEIGLDNNRMVHVLSGLEEGEEVLLTPPLREGEVGLDEPPEVSGEQTVPAPADRREEMRKRREQMSPEERAAARERFRGNGPGEGVPAGGQEGR